MSASHTYSSMVNGTCDSVRSLAAGCRHPAVMKRINMSISELTLLQQATRSTHERLVAALIAAGKFNYQAFATTPPPKNDGQCTAWMRGRCNNTSAQQQTPLFIDMGSSRGTLPGVTSPQHNCQS